MTLAEQREARADILAEEAVRGGQHQTAEPGAGAAAAGIGDALDGKRGLFGRERVSPSAVPRNSVAS